MLSFGPVLISARRAYPLFCTIAYGSIAVVVDILLTHSRSDSLKPWLTTTFAVISRWTSPLCMVAKSAFGCLRPIQISTRLAWPLGGTTIRFWQDKASRAAIALLLLLDEGSGGTVLCR